jgi:organic radical activating enzyme
MAKIAQRAAEYNLTEHCNLKCAGCNHFSPHLPQKFADLEQFQRDLNALSEVMHLGELKLLGGEPLLHPDLLQFLQCARESGLADEITLVTNGLLLHRCDPLAFELIDRLWVSVYPGVELPLATDELDYLSKRYNFSLDLKKTDSFRCTTVNKRHRDAALVRPIFDRCELAHARSCHTIDQGYYFKCSPAPFLTARMALEGEPVANRDLDAVRIFDNPNLRAELESYLRSDEPLEACYYCLGSSGRRFPHRQLKRGEVHDESYAHELEAAGTIALRRGDRAFARRCYRSAIRAHPFKLATYLRLARTFLPHGVAPSVARLPPPRPQRRLSGPLQRTPTPPKL